MFLKQLWRVETFALWYDNIADVSRNFRSNGLKLFGARILPIFLVEVRWGAKLTNSLRLVCNHVIKLFKHSN